MKRIGLTALVLGLVVAATTTLAPQAVGADTGTSTTSVAGRSKMGSVPLRGTEIVRVHSPGGTSSSRNPDVSRFTVR